MHRVDSIAALVALALLAGCSPGGKGGTPASAASPIAVANAEYARLRSQGPDATAREFTKIEYPLTRDLMKAGGLDAALGGEAKADAALRALYALYEHEARAFEAELPTLFDKRSGGGGSFGSGGDAGWGGTTASSLTSGMQNAAGESSWERAQDEGQSSGNHTEDFPGGKSSVEWTENGYTTTTTFEGNLPEGLKGKLTTKVKSVACPDAQGKVEVEFESTSDLTAGNGSAQTTVSSKLTRYLDDDANLIDDQMDSDTHAEQSTGAGSHVDVTDTLSTSRGEMGSKVNGRNRGASDEDVQMAQAMAKMGRMAAMFAVETAKKAWESGRCVKLDVRSDPARRTGAKPNTAYTLFAEPRAKSDGAPTRGTVKATLSGEHMLNPRDKKVPADAQFDYQSPENKDQSATIDFEARSKRGVGKASLQFDTKKGGYRITLDNGESITTCDITKPFSGKIGRGMVTLAFTPGDDRSGRMAFHFASGRGVADTAYDYTLSGPEEKMTGTFRANSAVCGKAAGLGACAAPRKQTFMSTWTRIDDCGAAQ